MGSRPERGRAGVRVAAALVALSVPTLAGDAEAQEVTYTGSLQYSTGSYVFTERTHSFYLMTGLSARGRGFEVDASIPFIVQNSRLITYVGNAPLPTGGPDHLAVRRREPGAGIPTRRGGGTGRSGMGRSGGLARATLPGAAQATDSVTYADDYSGRLGDPFLEGALEIAPGDGFLRSLRLKAGTKAPLADLDSGVGTGEWDYLAGGSVMFAVGGLYFFADVGWWWLGDLPDLELRDGPSYGLGIGKAVFDGRSSLLFTLAGARASIVTVDAPLIAGVSLGHDLGQGRSLSLGASVGLSEASPDLSVLLGWALEL